VPRAPGSHEVELRSCPCLEAVVCNVSLAAHNFQRVMRDVQLLAQRAHLCVARAVAAATAILTTAGLPYGGIVCAGSFDGTPDAAEKIDFVRDLEDAFVEPDALRVAPCQLENLVRGRVHVHRSLDGSLRLRKILRPNPCSTAREPIDSRPPPEVGVGCESLLQ